VIAAIQQFRKWKSDHYPSAVIIDFVGNNCKKEISSKLYFLIKHSRVSEETDKSTGGHAACDEVCLKRETNL
jgi:hypothetical protein